MYHYIETRESNTHNNIRYIGTRGAHNELVFKCIK